jgi:hypothetical protein
MTLKMTRENEKAPHWDETLKSPPTAGRQISMDYFVEDLESSPLAGPSKLLKNLVSAAGFEPATHALKGHCSTT